MLENIRRRLARWIAPAAAKVHWLQTRMYQSARGGSLTAGFGNATTSADTELSSSLTALRNRSRALVRDAAYAKRAKVVVQNNVIGSGIGMQAQVMSSRDTLRDTVNDAIEEAFAQWSCAEYCHTGGALCFPDFERAVMGQVFEAGECIVRKHYTAFGGSPIPFALELIESERIADELSYPTPPAAQVAPGATIRMGIEVDRYGRALAYWLRRRHPGETRFTPAEPDLVERVPAEQIIHLRIIDRWPQTRGEPWLHTVVRKLNDMDAYTEAEIIAARASAQYLNIIESPAADMPLAQKPTDAPAGSGEREIVTEPGMTLQLRPGEKFSPHTPNRPNTALDPFMRYMLREMAAGTNVSYESLSRDYSQSNYSGGRLGLLDDRDLWRVLQQWFLRNFRHPLHKEWLQQAVLARAIAALRIEEYAVAPAKFEAVRFKPRGWSWVDPAKEVAAYKEAVMAGFMTVADVIAITADGRDLEDVMRGRERELAMMKQLGLVFDTSPEVYTKPAAGPGKPSATKGPDPDDPDNAHETNGNDDDPQQRVVSIRR